MADSEDHSQIASGEPSESAMSVRSAELSVCLKCVYLFVCLNPLAALPLLQFENLTNCHTADAGAHHDTHHSLVGGPSAEKKQKQSIPGLGDFELDGDAPIDIIMGPCQFPDMLAPHRNVEGRYSTFLIGFSSNAHATGRDLSYNKPLKLVCNYREAWDRCIYYYEDEVERLWQWRNFLMQLEAGAADDKDDYRKLVAQLSPMLIPPFKGTNTRTKQVTADVRYATSYGLSPVGCTASHITVLMATAHLTARYALDAEGVVETSYYNMLTACCNKQLSAVYRYQTLWTDANWSDAVKETYIMQSVLPSDFVLSIYYAMSREMLALASNKKSQTKVKKVITPGCEDVHQRITE